MLEIECPKCKKSNTYQDNSEYLGYSRAWQSHEYRFICSSCLHEWIRRDKDTVFTRYIDNK